MANNTQKTNSLEDFEPRPKQELKNRNNLRRVDLELFCRFLTVISEAATIGITSLQMKTGTNHTTCTKYVVLLEKLELVKLDAYEANKQIRITEKGKESLRIMSSYFQ
jgi:predicted transcriptional regulator